MTADSVIYKSLTFTERGLNIELSLVDGHRHSSLGNYSSIKDAFNGATKHSLPDKIRTELKEFRAISENAGWDFEAIHIEIIKSAITAELVDERYR